MFCATRGARAGLPCWNPFHLPLWAAVIGILLIYQAVIWPLRTVRHAVIPRFYGDTYPWHAFWDALVGLFIFVVAVWYFGHHGQGLQHSFGSLRRKARPAWHRCLLAWQTLINGAH